MKKVITYGTYDLFHQGHYNLLKRAKALGDYLIVGVTSDYFDKSRGKFNVHDDLMTRIENVKKTGFADQIVVEEYFGQKIDDIKNMESISLPSDPIGKDILTISMSIARLSILKEPRVFPAPRSVMNIVSDWASLGMK